MLRKHRRSFLTLCLIAAAILQVNANAYDPGYRNHIARHPYYNGYGAGVYGGRGAYGGSGWGNNGYSGYGNGPYGYGSGSAYLFPTSNTYGNYYNGYGNYYNGYGSAGVYGSNYDYGYNPYGGGVYASFNNGW